MTSHQRLLERLVRHQIAVQRFGGSQVKAAMPIIRQLARDLRGRIAAGDASELQMGRMVALERDLQQLAATATGRIQGALDLEDFAVSEATFAQKLLGASVSVDLAEGLDLDAVRAITTRRQMQLVQGKTIKRATIPQLWEEFAGAAGRDALRVVQAGVLEGRTQQDLAREVSTLIQTRTRRQAEAVIRTSVNHIGGAARNSVYASNSDILDGERFLATLDSRVTISCASFDQTVHPLGRGPIPPLHWGCRSLRIPEIKPEYRLAAKGERASEFGPESNQLSYGGFLRRQDAEYQDKVLGPKKAELFRRGNIKIDQFTDDNGIILSLEQLEALER